jgi:hypothetical protein
MKASISKYFFLYGLVLQKIKSEIITNKPLFEFFFKDNEKNRELLNNMINRHRKIYLSPLDIITGGIPRFFLWQSTRLTFYLSNLIFEKDLFIKKNTLIKYGELQRNKLINFLKGIENNKEKDFSKENIIKEIGLDLLAFGDKTSIFYQNIEILHKWINEKITESTYDESKISLSLKFKLISLKLQILAYMPPTFIKESLSAFFSKLNSLFTPFKVFEVIKNFDNKSLITLYKENLEFQKYMENLKKEMVTNPEKKKEYENLSKVLEQGLVLPIKNVFKDMDKIELKTTKEKSSIIDKFWEFIHPITHPLKKANILTTPMDFSKLNKDFNNLLIKNDPNSDNKIFLDAINNHEEEAQLREIKFLRDNILYENAMIEKIQEKKVFIPAFWMEFIVSKFQEILENKLTSTFEGVISTFTLKTQNSFNNFVESIILVDEDNIKIENFLKILIKNIKTNGPLPSILIGVNNSQIEGLIKNYVYSLIKTNPISRYKIRNPFTITKISLNKITKKNTKPKDLQTLARKIFHENINNFNNFLKVHFLHEEVKYMTFLSKLQIETLRMSNKLLDYMSNPLYLGRKIFSVIEVSGLELLCGARNESKKKNTYSMATSTFVNYVSGVLYTDKFLFAFTSDLKAVDEAVKSRFTICTKITNTGSLEFYVILVRRYLLNLMLKYKNILLLDEETFEKVLIDLSYEFYVKNWTGSEVNRFFLELEDKKRLKSYNGKYSKKQILKLMGEVLV